MKVLFANKFFFRKGGAEAVMFDEIEIMRRCEVDVVEFSMQEPHNHPSKYDSYFVSEKSYRSGSRTTKVQSRCFHSSILGRPSETSANLIRDEKPDILHCHNIYHQLTPSIINVASRLQTPVVLTLHDYKPVCPVYTRLRHGQPCTECAGGRFEAVAAASLR